MQMSGIFSMQYSLHHVRPQTNMNILSVAASTGKLHWNLAIFMFSLTQNGACCELGRGGGGSKS